MGGMPKPKPTASPPAVVEPELVDPLVDPLQEIIDAQGDPDREKIELPSQKPEQVPYPVTDQASAEMVIERLTVLDLTEDALKAQYDRRKRVITHQRNAILRSVGAYNRTRADGEGTQEHWGTLEDWGRDAIHRKPGKTKFVDTTLARVAIRNAPERFVCTDIDELHQFAMAEGEPLLTTLELKANLGEIKAYFKRNNKLPPGAKRLEGGRYQSFSISSAGK